MWKWFQNGLQLKNDKYNNLRTPIKTKIYYKSNVFNVAFQQRIRIVFHFNSKLNNYAEWNKREEELANKIDDPSLVIVMVTVRLSHTLH